MSEFIQWVLAIMVVVAVGLGTAYGTYMSMKKQYGNKNKTSK